MADRLEAALVDADIRAQRHRAAAGRIFAERWQEIAAELKAGHITIAVWCRQELGPGRKSPATTLLRVPAAIQRLVQV